MASNDMARNDKQPLPRGSGGPFGSVFSSSPVLAAYQGLTLVRVTAQFEQLQDTFRS